MYKYHDACLCFTLKNNTIENIDKIFDEWLNEVNTKEDFIDFGSDYDYSKEPITVLHHCFLPEYEAEQRGFGTDLYDFLGSVCEEMVCWHGVTAVHNPMLEQNYLPVLDRRAMFRNLKRVNGLAIFIGDIIGGVEEEYKMAKEIGVDMVHLPTLKLNEEKPKFKE